MSTDTPEPRRSVKERLRGLYREYGSLAVWVFAVLWVVVLGGIWTAMQLGWSPESAAGKAGTFGAAYLVFRLTLPVRIAAALLLTPLVARVLARLGLRRPPDGAGGGRGPASP